MSNAIRKIPILQYPQTLDYRKKLLHEPKLSNRSNPDFYSLIWLYKCPIETEATPDVCQERQY